MVVLYVVLYFRQIVSVNSFLKSYVKEKSPTLDCEGGALVSLSFRPILVPHCMCNGLLC